jgi:hypothetical protein
MLKDKQISDYEVKGDTMISTIDTIDSSKGETKNMFYSLPSPVETAMLIKRSKVDLDIKLLNSFENYNRYSTRKSQALNLGIYRADMSFTSLYEDVQSTYQYFFSIKKVSKSIGIGAILDDLDFSELDEGFKSSTFLNIMSESFLKSDAHLIESGNAEVAAMIVLGSWTECVYMAFQLSENVGHSNPKLINRIKDQKFALENVVKLLEQLKDDKNIYSLIDDVEDLKALYDEMNSTRVKLSTLEEGASTGNMILGTKIGINKKLFKKANRKVKVLRNKFINLK